MLLTGIQSLGTIDKENPEPGYRMIAGAGFSCVDFNFDDFLPSSVLNQGKVNDFFSQDVEKLWEYFRFHAELAEKYGLSFYQMHAPFPVSRPDGGAFNDKLWEVLIKSMELCSRMGGKYLVVHPVTLRYSEGHEAEYSFNMAMYERMIPLAKKYGIVICLENMFVDRQGHYGEGVCSDFTEAAAYIDQLNQTAQEELFGFCFDVGHANILGKDMRTAIETLGSRLKILHIHDNDGREDLHTMPYTFIRGWNTEPATDWEGILQGLKNIHYSGVVNFETFRCMLTFPKELHPSVVKLLGDMGKYFVKRIES